MNAQPIIVPAQPETAMGALAPSGKLAFDTCARLRPGAQPARRTKHYFAEELFYLRDRPNTGVLGSSRLSRAPMLVQQGLNVQAFATYLWDADGDRLIPQAVGGRPEGTGDGEGGTLPVPGCAYRGNRQAERRSGGGKFYKQTHGAASAAQSLDRL